MRYTEHEKEQQQVIYVVSGKLLKQCIEWCRGISKLEIELHGRGKKGEELKQIGKIQVKISGFVLCLKNTNLMSMRLKCAGK